MVMLIFCTEIIFSICLNKNIAFAWIHLIWQRNSSHRNNQAEAWFHHLCGNWFSNGKIHHNCVDKIPEQNHLTIQDSTSSLHVTKCLYKLLSGKPTISLFSLFILGLSLSPILINWLFNSTTNNNFCLIIQR